MAKQAYPRFDGLNAASRTASRIKSSNRKTDTSCERALRNILWHRGFRYRKNVRNLPGTPDIVFPRHRLAVFCDGDFWHGRDWTKRERKLAAGSNPSYWVKKISRNRARAVEVQRLLEADGWSVLRLWETDILKAPDEAADRIESGLKKLGESHG